MTATRLPVPAALGWVFGAVAIALLTRGATAQSATVWDGVFTTAQASRGEAAYQKACATCHGPALGGDAFAPPLVGEPFTTRWQDGTLSDVLVLVKTTMPQDMPATLSADTYADIVAFLLKSNNYPAGQREISQNPDQVKDVRFTKAPSPGR
jgi:quinoprotein glucose dehydrogenase